MCIHQKVKSSTLELNKKIEILKKRSRRYKQDPHRIFRTNKLK